MLLRIRTKINYLPGQVALRSESLRRIEAAAAAVVDRTEVEATLLHYTSKKMLKGRVQLKVEDEGHF